MQSQQQMHASGRVNRQRHMKRDGDMDAPAERDVNAEGDLHSKRLQFERDVEAELFVFVEGKVEAGSFELFDKLFGATFGDFVRYETEAVVCGCAYFPAISVSDVQALKRRG